MSIGEIVSMIQEKSPTLVAIHGKDRRKLLEAYLKLVNARVDKKEDNFYESRAWRELRYKVLKRDGRRCACCGATPLDGVSVHVDHIKPRSKFPQLQLDASNLQVLCSDCNIGKSNKDATNWRAKMAENLWQYH